MIKQILFILGGGILGFAYYYFIGCNQGCAITGSPMNSTLYGAFMGLILAWPSNQKETKS